MRKFYLLLIIGSLLVVYAVLFATNNLNIDSSIDDIIEGLPNEERIIQKEVFNSEKQVFLSINNQKIPYYKKQLKMNYSVGEEIIPQYIVIHETNNTSNGADADAHYRYWNSNPNANTSTHFVVDSKQIYQMLELNQKAWHVGDNKGYSNITNNNSIGIEIAVNADGDYNLSRQHAIELTIQIMKQLNMNIDQLKRHYDASGKNCPTIMLANPSLWTDFVSQVQAGLQK